MIMQFEDISSELTSQFENCTPGKMMSSEAIKKNGKVFCFAYDDEMVFRLGFDFNPKEYNIHNATLLNPFKNKPPMKDWWVIPSEHNEHWKFLAVLAYDKM